VPRNGERTDDQLLNFFRVQALDKLRKSLLRGIGVGSLSQFKEDLDPLLRGHLRTGNRVGGIGFFKGVKNADYFLHIPIYSVV
jgi:hypothetical protein